MSTASANESAVSDAEAIAVSEVPGQAASAEQLEARPSRRALTMTALAVMVGGAVAWIASGRVWAHGIAGEAPSTFSVSATGTDISSAISVLALASIAGALALFATTRWARTLVAAFVAIVGAALTAVAATSHDATHALAAKATAKGLATGVTSVHTASWWLLALLGGLIVLAAGAFAAVRGRTWPGMSARYEKAPRRVEPETPKGLWDALDRGEDPTG